MIFHDKFVHTYVGTKVDSRYFIFLDVDNCLSVWHLRLTPNEKREKAGLKKIGTVCKLMFLFFNNNNIFFVVGMFQEF